MYPKSLVLKVTLEEGVGLSALVYHLHGAEGEEGSWAGESRAVSDGDKSRKRKNTIRAASEGLVAATGPCRAGKGSVGPAEVQAGLGQAGSVAGRHSCTTQGFNPKLSRLSPKVSTVCKASGQNV